LKTVVFISTLSRTQRRRWSAVKFLKIYQAPYVVVVAAETYKNNNNTINIQLCVCVKCVRIRRIWFFDCVVSVGPEVKVIGVAEDLWRSPTGLPLPLFTGTNWTKHYRPQTTNEGLVGLTGGSLNARLATYLPSSRNPTTYKKCGLNDITKTWPRFEKPNNILHYCIILYYSRR